MKVIPWNLVKDFRRLICFLVLMLVSVFLVQITADASDNVRTGGMSSADMQGYQVQSIEVMLDPSNPSILLGLSLEVYGNPIATQVQVALGADGPWVVCDVSKTVDHADGLCMLPTDVAVQLQDWDTMTVVALSG